jgi:ABC-type transport system involved in Fe-S cluster assembly fused permease/ATPase subunit
MSGTCLSVEEVFAVLLQMALVSQEVLLFSGTVLDNIQFGCPEAALGEVVEAARAAHAHEFIMQLPDGYNTRLGETGSVQLSGEFDGGLEREVWRSGSTVNNTTPD